MSYKIDEFFPPEVKNIQEIKNAQSTKNCLTNRNIYDAIKPNNNIFKVNKIEHHDDELGSLVKIENTLICHDK